MKETKLGGSIRLINSSWVNSAITPGKNNTISEEDTPTITNKNTSQLNKSIDTSTPLNLKL